MKDLDELSKKIDNMIKLAQNGYFGDKNFNELINTLGDCDVLVAQIKQELESEAK